MVESRAVRIRWYPVKYTVEKFTCFRRSQVIVMVLTTISTELFCKAVIRSADERIRYSTADGVPKMSRATSPAMSTSKPVISPVIGSRNENRLLPMSRPTSRRPRCLIEATAASAAALLENGRRLAVRSQSFSAGSGGRGASGLSSSIPAGVGGARVGAGGAGGSPPWAHPASRPNASATQVNFLMPDCLFFARALITDTRSPGARGPAPPPAPPRPTAAHHRRWRRRAPGARR